MNTTPNRSFVRRHWPILVLAGAVLGGIGYGVASAVERARSAARRSNDL
jgi:hypothetical protein